MYKIYSDGYIVYHPRLPEYAILSGRLELEVNKAGKLTFKIPESNPNCGMMMLMKSIVELYDDDELIFRGRPYAPSQNIYRDNEIICEGELAFLNDTYQEPFEFYGTVTELFSKVISFHNDQVSSEKRFKVGMIDVTENTAEGYMTESSNDYLTTWDFIQEKFLSTLGGYLHIRHEENDTYIDYLTDLNFLSDQDVRQGINLLDVVEEISTDDLATVVIPLGAKVKDEKGSDTDDYTTIESVNPGGKIYLSDQEGVETYGWIIKVTHHDDIIEPSDLLRAGRSDLADALGVASSVDLTASDLSKAGYDIKPFAIGTYVPVKIQNLDLNENMLIKKMTVDLLNPQSSNISLGAVSRSFVADKINTEKAIGKIYNNIAVDKKQVNEAINQIRKEMASQLEQTEEYIMSTVTEKYFSKEETEELISSVSTEIEQNSGAIEIRFNQLQQQVTEVGDTIVTQNQFIRLENGEVIIGKSESPVVSVYTNDALEFRYNGATVARFTNEVLSVRNINVENQLKINEGWAYRMGKYIEGAGYNLDMVWLGE